MGCISQLWVTLEEAVSGSTYPASPSPLAGGGLSKLRLMTSLLVSWQALLNREMRVTVTVPTLELKEDSLALLLPTTLRSCGLPAAQQKPAAQLLLAESRSQDPSGYCANGFGPACHEGGGPARAHSQRAHALGSRGTPRLEEDGEACDGDGVLEQLVPLGLTRDSYTGDGDYQAPETWLSLHLQLYSKCQCPAPRAGSCLPLPAPGSSFSQDDLRETLGVAGHWVLLSSVKLPASEEEDEGQGVGALQPLHGCGTEPQPGDSTVQPGGLEQAAPASPLPDAPRAAAFSGYELRPPAAGDT